MSKKVINHQLDYFISITFKMGAMQSLYSLFKTDDETNQIVISSNFLNPISYFERLYNYFGCHSPQHPDDIEFHNLHSYYDQKLSNV